VVALNRGAEFVKDVTFQGKSTAYVNFGSQVQAVLNELRAPEPTSSLRDPAVSNLIDLTRFQTASGLPAPLTFSMKLL
jgi:hypothetical protein